MKSKKQKAFFKGMLFVIEEDNPQIGVYLYIYDENKSCIKDFLQNTVEDCKEIAFELFNVPLDSWDDNVPD